MGRDKKQPRTKGNAQTASSARLQDLLTQSVTGDNNTGGFIGFSAFNSPLSSSSPASISTGGAELPGDFGLLSNDLSLIIRKLAKRDTVTKIKACEELRAYLLAENAYALILPLWPDLYSRLSNDIDRRVRALTAEIHASLVSTVGKKMAPYLKRIMISWLPSFYDAKEIAKTANECFCSAFPKTKQLDAIRHVAKELIEYISDTVLQQTPESLSDPRFTSKEDMIAKHARMMSSCLFVLEHILYILPKDDLSFVQEDINILLNNSALWHYVRTDQAVIRKSIYKLVKVIAEYRPDLLQGELVDHICVDVLAKMFEEKDRVVTADMWDAMLTLLKVNGEMWTIAGQKSKKSMDRKLFHYLRSAVHGQFEASYPAITVLVTLLPDELTMLESFWHSLLDSFIKAGDTGLLDQNSQEPFWRAYIDLIYVGVLKLIRRDLAAGEDGASRLSLLQQEFRDFCKLYYFNADKLNPPRPKFPIIMSDILMSFLVRLTKRDITDQWYCMESVLVQGIEDRTPISEYTFIAICNLSSSLIVCKEEYVKLLCRLMDITLAKLTTGSSISKWDAQLTRVLAQAVFDPTTKQHVVTFLQDHFLNLLANSFEPEHVDMQQELANELLLLYISYTAIDKSELCTSMWMSIIDVLLEGSHTKEAVFFLHQITLANIAVYSRSAKLEQYVLDAIARLEQGIAQDNDIEIVLVTISNEDRFLSPTTIQSVYIGVCKPIGSYDAINGVEFTSLYPHLKMLNYLLSSSATYRHQEVPWTCTKLLEIICINDYLSDRDKDILDLCWKSLTETVMSQQLSDDVIAQLMNTMSSYFAQMILSLAHPISAHQLARYVSFILTLVRPCNKLAMLSDTILNHQLWRQLGKDSFYSEVSLGTVFPVLITDLSITLAPTILTDQQGFTLFSRVVLTFGELIPKLEQDVLQQMVFNVGTTSLILPVLVSYLVMHRDQAQLRGNWLGINSNFDNEFCQVDNAINTLLKTQCGSNQLQKVTFDKLFDSQMDDSNLTPLEQTLVALLCSASQSHIFLRAITVYLKKLLTCQEQSIDATSTEYIAQIVNMLNRCRGDVNRTKALCAIMSAFDGLKNTSVALERVREDACRNILLIHKDILSDEGLSWLLLVNAISHSTGRVLIRHKLCIDVIDRLDTWTAALAITDEITTVNRQVVVLFQITRITAKAVITLDDSLSEKDFAELVSKCWIWLDYMDLIRHEEASNLLLHQVICILLQLFDIARRNPTLQRCFGDFEEFIQEKLIEFFFSRSDMELSTEPFEALLSDLGLCILQIPAKIVLQQKSANELYKLFGLHHPSTVIAAFVLLRRHTAVKTQELSLQFELSPTREMDNDSWLAPELSKLLQMKLKDLGEESAVAERLLHLRYLLTWLIVFESFQNATFHLRIALTDQLKMLDCIPNLLNYVYHTLLASHTSAFDLSKWVVDEFYIEDFSLSSDTSFSLLASYVWYKTFIHIPSLVRGWWTAQRDRQKTKSIESELLAIQSADKSKFDSDMSVKVSQLTNTNEIQATYKVEEVSIEMVITLHNTYPLRQVEVLGVNKAGVRERRWRSWLLCCQALMSAQNGSILDALLIFQRNVALHFAGQTECAICYSIVSVMDKSLPNRPCRTCKNKFHSACLFKAAARRSLLDRREQQMRQQEFQREDLVKKMRSEQQMDVFLKSEERADIQRGLREHRQVEAERSFIETLRKEQEEREMTRLQRIREQRITEDIQREQSAKLRDEKIRQAIKANSTELRELEHKLTNAYTIAGRARQLNEKKLSDQQAKRMEEQYAEQLNKQVARAQEEELDHEKEMICRSKQYKQELQGQLADREERQQADYEQFMKEKSMVDELIRRITEEDQREIRHQFEKQQETKQFIEKYLVDRDVYRREEERKISEENKRIEEFARSQHEREIIMQQKKKAAAEERGHIYELLSGQMQEQEKQKQEVEDLRIELHRHEQSEREVQREQEAAQKRIQQRLELIDAHKEQIQNKRRRLQIQKEQEDVFRQRMMQKFAEEEKLEQLSAQRRRLKQLEHKRAVDDMVEERRKMEEQRRQQDLEEQRKEEELERFRAAVIEQERQRLLREHASKLGGYLPKGVLRDERDLDLFDEEFRRRFGRVAV